MDENKVMSNDIEKLTADTTKPRRQFLKKAGIATGVTMLPATSVWGACNQSGISGGSRSFMDVACSSMSIINQRSPGSWSKLTYQGNWSNIPNKNKSKLIAMHSALSQHSSDATVKLYYEQLSDLLNTVTMEAPSIQMPSGSIVGSGRFTLAAALNGSISDKHNTKRHMTATLLNLIFELTSLPSGFTYQTMMEHMWTFSKVKVGFSGWDGIISYNETGENTKHDTAAKLGTGGWNKGIHLLNQMKLL